MNRGTTKEKPIRSVVKAISWRFTATTITIVASLIITGKMDTAMIIGGVDFVIKLLVYFIHERLWLRSKFGLTQEPEYHI